MTRGMQIPSSLIIGFSFLIGIFAALSSAEINTGLWNAALNKPAYQTKVHSELGPQYAVDGNKGNNGGPTCPQTKWAKNNWWIVDLIDDYLVHEIIVTNKKGHAARFQPVDIDLFLSDPREHPSFPTNTNGILCAKVEYKFKVNETFACPSPTCARFVKVLKTDKDVLHFCELEAMVSKKRGDPDRQKPVPKHFQIMRNSIVENGHIEFTTTTTTALMCVNLCAEKEYLCTGCYWSEVTKDCQILNINPYNVGPVVNKEGTDLYVRSPTCV